MSEENEIFQDTVKKRMLESAVENIPELANIKDIDNNCIARTGGGTVEHMAQKRSGVKGDRLLKINFLI